MRRDALKAKRGQMPAPVVLNSLGHDDEDNGNPAAPAEAALRTYHAAVSDRLEQQAAEIARLQGDLEQISASTTAERMHGGSTPRVAQALERQRQDMVAFIRTGVMPRNSLSVDSNPDGGFTVGEDVEQQIGSVLRNQSPLRQLATVKQIGSASYKRHMWIGGNGAGWTSEKGSRPQTANSTLVQIEIPAEEMYSLPYATQWLLDDSRVNMADEIIAEITQSFADLESAAYVNGTGTGQPRGFLTYTTATTADASRSFGTVQRIHTGDANGFVTSTASASPVDVLKRMIFSLKIKHRQNATWLMSSDTALQLSLFKDPVNGEYLLEKSNQVGMPDTLLGRPIAYDENMPSVAAGTFPIALADWNAAYYIVDRVGLTVLRDPFTNKPLVGFYARKRVGGGVMDTNAIKLLKVSA